MLNNKFLYHHALHIMVGSFVLVCSFIYGITAGLMKNRATAYASGAGQDFFGEMPTQTFRKLSPLKGMIVSPMGADIFVNNHPAEMLSFVSGRTAIELLEEQANAWRSDGLQVGISTGQFRGFVLAGTRSGSERYMMSAWTVPEVLREQASNGFPTSGTLTALEIAPGDQTAENGLSEVPVRPGGRGGAILSSQDPAGRTYSTVYTVPGSIRENIEYYRSELEIQGWKELNAFAAQPEQASFEVGNVIFQRAGEEIVMLFSPLQEDTNSGQGIRTVISISKGPLNIERWKSLK